MTTELDRRSALCRQTQVTGIDFVLVLDPAVQTTLRVFFVVDPTILTVVPALAPALAALPPGQDAGPPVAATLEVRIVAPATGRVVEVVARSWRRVRTSAGVRPVLEIQVAEPGDFAIHRLRILGRDDAVDRFFNDVTFSFKQACPSDFDCRTDCEPVPVEGPDFPVDYLARDFHSLRRALLDFVAQRYPQWSQPLEADQVVMLLEIMAALGDEFAYTQDRYAREAALETATQRRSRSSLARLVDYVPDPGSAAHSHVAIFVTAGAGGAEPPAGARVWALREGVPPIPFSVTAAPASGQPWHHEQWNAIALHCWDSRVACLEQGATTAYLATAAPTPEQLPPGATVGPGEFWRGRRAFLRSRPRNPGQPERAWLITIDAVETGLVDPLITVNGIPQPLTRITWLEPTPWPLMFGETELLGNVAMVVAGEQLVERFRVGSDRQLEARFPGLASDQLAKALALPRAVEREGPWDEQAGGRDRILRYGLRGAETLGLGWQGERDPIGLRTAQALRPMISLREVRPPAFGADLAGATWRFHADVLAADRDEPAFTLEEGTWREVVTHRTPTEDFVFQDYAADAGWSLRFGDGYFGRPPEGGTVFEVRYFIAPGSIANLAADSITMLTSPGGAAPDLAYAMAVTNPLPITTGRDEEPPARVRTNAPEAFRALPLRAVRPEDFAEIVERLPWVQRANATTCWTGSWSTEFVAADPRGGFQLSAGERRQLGDLLDCVRQATRDARTLDPDYLDIDLAVHICVRPDSHPGEVAERVGRALAPPGFFGPDNFTFGQPLRRSALEAAIHRVPGVQGVEGLRIRVRRHTDWEPFAEPELTVVANQILRLQNDPLLPGRGSLRVYAHGGSA